MGMLLVVTITIDFDLSFFSKFISNNLERANGKSPGN